jgi:hypothetical protein
MNTEVYSGKQMEKINFETNLTLVDEVAEASISLNPLFRWAKFVLTDDLPNGNKKRIPREEFANIIRTGLYTPIKMKLGGISRGHEFSVPLGVITNLAEEENTVVGLAALWEKEREADVNLIKSMKDNQLPVNISWELYHSDSSLEEDGVEAYRGVVLRAATIVGEPAYKGRTPILKMASLESQIMELEELQAKVAELTTAVETLTASVAEKEQELASVKEEFTALETEKVALAEFKQTIELAEQKKQKLADIKLKFNEAGIKKGDEYFQENEEKLLGLDEAALIFMLQEMATLASASLDNKSISGNDVPPLNSKKSTVKDPKELGKLLRELK